MGFPIVEIRMPDYDGAEARLQQWLTPVGAYATWNCPFAHILIDGVLLQLICEMPVKLKETKAECGMPVVARQLLALAWAEVHEIPRRLPYTRLERAVR